MREMNNKKKKNKHTYNILFVTAVFFSILFLAIPILIYCPWIRSVINIFLKFMGPYKSSYFEACGAMIGTFLAVASAIWIQNRSDAKQRNDAIKKYATIVYFDIDKFYKENDIFASRVIDLYHAYAQQKATAEETITIFEQWRQYASIYIDDEWIPTVAELGAVLSKQQIDDIYGFYGNVEYIKGKLCNIITPSCDDIKMIVSHLHNIGERETYYRPNKAITNILTVLDGSLRELN